MADQAVEAGIEVRLVTLQELAELVRTGAFTLQLHIGTLMLAGLRGFIDLTAFGPMPSETPR